MISAAGSELSFSKELSSSDSDFNSMAANGGTPPGASPTEAGPTAQPSDPALCPTGDLLADLLGEPNAPPEANLGGGDGGGGGGGGSSTAGGGGGGGTACHVDGGGTARHIDGTGAGGSTSDGLATPQQAAAATPQQTTPPELPAPDLSPAAAAATPAAAKSAEFAGPSRPAGPCHGLTAAVPVGAPHCSCKLTRVLTAYSCTPHGHSPLQL